MNWNDCWNDIAPSGWRSKPACRLHRRRESIEQIDAARRLFVVALLGVRRTAGARCLRMACKFFGRRPREPTKSFRLAAIMLSHTNSARVLVGHGARAGQMSAAPTYVLLQIYPLEAELLHLGHPLGFTRVHVPSGSLSMQSAHSLVSSTRLHLRPRRYKLLLASNQNSLLDNRRPFGCGPSSLALGSPAPSGRRENSKP
jgi:hypothetical protein